MSHYYWPSYPQCPPQCPPKCPPSPKCEKYDYPKHCDDVKPIDSACVKEGCCVKIGYIGEASFSAEWFQRLRKTKSLYPGIKAMDARFIPSGLTLDQIVQTIERHVCTLRKDGYQHICINTISTNLTPWILGTMGGLNNRNTDQRWPDVTFAIGNNTLADEAGNANGVISQVGNVLRFGDINTGNSVAEKQLFVPRPFGGQNPQQIIMVFQQGDNPSLANKADYEQIATNLGIPFVEAPVVYDNVAQEFTAASLQSAGQIISDANDAGTPDRVLVAIAVNGTFTDVFATNAKAQTPPNIFLAAGGVPYRAGIQYLGANYAPSNVIVPVKIWARSSSGVSQPSNVAVMLGWQKSIIDLFNAEGQAVFFLFAYFFLEAIAYFANCGDISFPGDQDSRFQFDEFRTRIDILAAFQDIEANTLPSNPANSFQLSQNPRTL